MYVSCKLYEFDIHMISYNNIFAIYQVVEELVKLLLHCLELVHENISVLAVYFVLFKLSIAIVFVHISAVPAFTNIFL